VAFEQGQVAAAAGGGGPSGEIAVGVAREYVWGPGDRGIDELLVQYDKNRKAWYAIQDAGGDVVALCDVPTSGTARVAGQWTYDAYGNVIFAEHLVSHQPLHCGHKAAFVERLDVGVYSSSSSENHRLIPFAHSISHMRNRVYAPGIGRFMQPDPYATAAHLLQQDHWFHGKDSPAAFIDLFDLYINQMNGNNIYEYLGSNPILRADPMGLYWSGLRPGQLIGPGWSQGGIDFVREPRDMVRVAQANNAAQIAKWWLKKGLEGSREELEIGAFQMIGAGLAHVLFGQDGAASRDVLGATLHQIAKRAGIAALGNLPLPYLWDCYEGVNSSLEGDFYGAGVSTVKGATRMLQDHWGDLLSVSFKSAAKRFAGIAIVGGGIYSGMMEYAVNDVYNWGFGVSGEELYDLWD
jgi:hypothetical protein